MLTIREVIKTFYNALLQKLKKHRGNWEQNDPTADDYIKNRPFYTDEINKETVVQTKTFTATNSYWWGSPFTFIPVVGETYKVTWDGEEYICQSYLLGDSKAIGNISINDEGPDTGEPFFYYWYDRSEYGLCVRYQGKHTITIEKIDVKKLDKRYLPDLGLAPVATSGDYWDLYNKPTVYTDVVRYNVSQSLSTTQKKTVRANIGAVGYDAAHNLTTNQRLQARGNIGAVGYESQTLTDAQKTQARTNIGAGTSNFSGNYNDLTNSPIREIYISDFGATYTWDGEIDGLEVYTTNVGSFYKISDYVPTYTEMNGASFSFREEYGGNNRVFNSTIVSCITDSNNSNNLLYNSDKIMVNNSGIWFSRYYGSSQNYRYIESLTLLGQATKLNFPLSNDSLPTTVPVIQSATVGQTIIVKSVNPNGKPTEWETVNFPSTDSTLTIEGSAADAKATGEVIAQLTEQKADKSELESAVAQLTEQKADKSELEKLNTPKDYIILIDQVNGFKYRIAMRNGDLVSYTYIDNIVVAQPPNKTTYTAGEYFDPTGMVISTVATDGTTVEVSEFVVDETYTNTYLTEDVIEVGISYTDDSGEVYTVSVPITVIPFDPAIILVDFKYIANDDGTYTISNWKGTLNGEASTEIIIPDNGLIIV